MERYWRCEKKVDGNVKRDRVAVAATRLYTTVSNLTYLVLDSIIYSMEGSQPQAHEKKQNFG